VEVKVGDDVVVLHHFVSKCLWMYES
jgi:hypothetical protein